MPACENCHGHGAVIDVRMRGAGGEAVGVRCLVCYGTGEAPPKHFSCVFAACAACVLDKERARIAAAIREELRKHDVLRLMGLKASRAFTDDLLRVVEGAPAPREG